jgi:hypothetical protein
MRAANVWFRIEVALGSLSLLAFIATLIWADWIELLFGVDPDGGDGTLERVVVLCLTAATVVVMAVLARRNLAKTPRAATGIKS